MARVSKEASEASELFVELFQEHKRSWMGISREHGLTPQQMATVWNLSPGQGVAMSALAELLMCDASNVTGIVDKLEARGLARRGQAEDRRVKVLTLTAEGEALQAQMRLQIAEPPRWVLALSREDQRTLRDILRRGLSAIQAADKT